MKFTSRHSLIAALACSTLLISCNNGSSSSNESQDALIPEETVNVTSESNTVLKLGKEVFSLPSPFQTTLLIKELKVPFTNEFLNNFQNGTKYSSNFKKALNFGVYGSDLGYATVYEQSQEALKYLSTCKRLGDDLGLSSIFNEELMSSFEQNFNNQDKLVKMISEVYMKADAVFKSSDLHKTSVLIAVGGWTEALYLSTQIAKTADNPKLTVRIGEQKNTVKNLIKMLEPYADDAAVYDLLQNYYDLESKYENVDIRYNYAEPETDVANKTTTIKSKSEVLLDTQSINDITESIQTIRTFIVEI